MNNAKTYQKATAGLSALLLSGAMWATPAMAQVGRTPNQIPSQTPNQIPNQNQNPNQTLGGADAGQIPGQPSPEDRTFVKSALQGGMAEVQLGQLTLQKSSNDQVKQFAQRMIDDHTRLGEQMKPIAQQLGVAVPTEVSKKDKQLMNKLQNLSGTAYDQAYIKDMVKDHKQDLSEFQLEASSGQDPAVKAAATQSSPIIAQHLQLAQQIAKDQNVDVARK